MKNESVSPMNHTPTPWYHIHKSQCFSVDDCDHGIELYRLPIFTDSLPTKREKITCEAYGSTVEETQQNAAFIVRACNSHDALVDALEYMVEQMAREYTDRDGDTDHHGLEKARVALRLAKGE